MNGHLRSSRHLISIVGTGMREEQAIRWRRLSVNLIRGCKEVRIRSGSQSLAQVKFSADQGRFAAKSLSLLEWQNMIKQTMFIVQNMNKFD